MKCACGSSLVSSLAVIVGLVGIGLGGYNFISTGCPLGGCHGESGVVPVAAGAEECPVKGVAHGDAKAGCCSEAGEKDCGLCDEHETPAPNSPPAEAPAAEPASNPA